jgi:hypothetical protein
VSGNVSCRMPPSAPWYDIECATLRKSVMNLRRQTLALHALEYDYCVAPLEILNDAKKIAAPTQKEKNCFPSATSRGLTKRY